MDYFLSIIYKIHSIDTLPSGVVYYLNTIHKNKNVLDAFKKNELEFNYIILGDIYENNKEKSLTLIKKYNFWRKEEELKLCLYAIFENDKFYEHVYQYKLRHKA